MDVPIYGNKFSASNTLEGFVFVALSHPYNSKPLLRSLRAFYLQVHESTREETSRVILIGPLCTHAETRGILRSQSLADLSQSP